MIFTQLIIIIIISHINYIDAKGYVSSDKQETHEDENVRYNNSHIIYNVLHVLFSVHVDNDINTVTNNDDISTEDIINTPDIQQEITTS